MLNVFVFCQCQKALDLQRFTILAILLHFFPVHLWYLEWNELNEPDPESLGAGIGDVAGFPSCHVSGHCGAFPGGKSTREPRKTKNTV